MWRLTLIPSNRNHPSLRVAREKRESPGTYLDHYKSNINFNFRKLHSEKTDFYCKNK